jgi:hypothetical protein
VTAEFLDKIGSFYCSLGQPRSIPTAIFFRKNPLPFRLSNDHLNFNLSQFVYYDLLEDSQLLTSISRLKKRSVLKSNVIII